ncbi:MAG TPA: response regulator [Chloroflexota bacterium]|nr:response regulator [Chloroflexota bacterium]
MHSDETNPQQFSTVTRTEPLGSPAGDPDASVTDWLPVQIQHALEHLYDYVYLQDLPLAGLIGGAAQGWNRGAVLHRFLVETIDQLKPPASAPTHSPLWRRYRYAFLRYIEAATVAQIVEELGVSERQARRDNNRVIEAVAGLLRQRLGPAALRNAPGTGEAPADPPPRSSPGSETGASRPAADPRGLTRLDEVVQSVLTTSQNLAESRGVEVAVHRGNAPVLVSAERTTIRQTVLTIVVGIVEIARPGDRVRVSVSADATTARVSVELPIAGPATARAGLEDRLALAGRLARPADGTVTADQHADAVRVTLAVPAAPFTTVLLVEDNPGMRRLMKRFLGGSGYIVLEARNADEAIAMANEYQPDVITLDVMMPSKDGWEVLQTLRAQPRTRHIPVLVCSVLKEGDLARSLGAAAVISKPITQEMLLQALASLRPPPER